MKYIAAILIVFSIMLISNATVNVFQQLHIENNTKLIHQQQIEINKLKEKLHIARMKH